MRPAWFVIVGCLALMGCQESHRAVVHGTVTIDGKPLEVGSISFIPTGATKGPTAGGTILAGQYRIAASKGVAIGANRIVMHGTRKTGKKLQYGQETLDEMVNAIPPEYGDKSQVVRQITEGENQLDFALTTGAR